MSKPAPPSYRATNWRAYNAALKQRGSLLIWFDPEMEWLAAPSGRRGRPAIFSDAAIQTCLTRDGRCSACRCDRSSHRGAIGSSPMARGAGGEPSEAGEAGLARPGLQHALPALERPDRPDPLPPEHGCPAPARRQHRHQGCWRRGVVHAQARGLAAQVMAQGAPWDRCGDDGGPGHRG